MYRDFDCDFRVQLPSVYGKHAKLRIDKSGKVQLVYILTLIIATPTMSSVNDCLHILSIYCVPLYAQAYISSLVPNVPVYINDSPVDSDVLVSDRAVLNIGTCSFKFQYEEGIFSPLRDENGTHSVKEVC